MTEPVESFAPPSVRWMRSLVAAAALSVSILTAEGCGSDPPQTLTVITGSLPLYHTQGMNPRNDVSGAAYLPALGSVLLVDDGGSSPQDLMPFYLMDPNGNFRLTSLDDQISMQHLDLEGATFDNIGNWAYVTSSMAVPALVDDGEGNLIPDPDNRPRNLSRFRLDDTGAVLEGATIAPRDAIVGAIQPRDVALWKRVASLDQKLGGLNVEGLSAAPEPGRLMIGLRSPHFGIDFPYVHNDPTKSGLRTGKAIVVEVDVSGDFRADALSPEMHLVRLDGLGIRSMEYSPTAGGYFVIAGIVEESENLLDDPDDSRPDFALYFWPGPSTEMAIPVSLPPGEVTCQSPIGAPTGDCFAGLCRPEAVSETVVNGKKYLFIASEESGDRCAEPVRPYNFLLIELNTPFLAKLR